ncbi:hypothetical protein LIP36_07705 [Amedibacillus dolichus]|uniref:hypothetical protein n=1 Tax=Amedibacillus dolichus TaxID=31971 RepID=UPI001D02CD1B|nr:hypothetical protein [Amedibacillus dolichus]MCB5373485.1 hypothetical protein [Amedibacillus dolichus]
MRNIEKIIEETKIKTGYDMKIDEIFTLKEKGTYESIYSAFIYGYAQGMKTIKTEMKQRGMI